MSNCDNLVFIRSYKLYASDYDSYSNSVARENQVRPKSAIYTPKRYDKHPCHFYMGVLPSREEFEQL